MMPNILVGVVDGSSLFKRWYFEAEVEHIEQMTKTEPLVRVGWANTSGFKPFLGSGDHWGCGAVGDCFYSYGFDGLNLIFGGKERRVGHRKLRRGDVVGCSLDLDVKKPEILFTLNGQPIHACYRHFNLDGFFFPVMSLSAKVSCRFIFGGTHGRLKYGPRAGFSPIIEALDKPVHVEECISFGDLGKTVYGGPSTILHTSQPFVPQPIDISSVSLPSFAHEIHQKFAENLHELWAMRKIDAGWGEPTKVEVNRKHQFLTTFEKLPPAEQQYNLNLATDTMKTIEALGYSMISDKPPTRLRPLRLPQK